MLSRRKLLLSATGLASAAGAYALFQSNHTLPPDDPAAEERFRQLQDALLASNGVPAISSFLDVQPPLLKVHVIEAGRGSPVLFVHGGNSVAVSWTPLLARLHTRFHLFAPDRPGCGLTTKFNYLGVPLRPHAVAFLTGVLDSLRLARAAIVGNSMGGYFALAFAMAHPERVAKLVLVGEPAGSGPTIRLSHRLMGTRIVNSALFGTILKPGPAATRSAFRRILVADVRRVSFDYLECMTAGAMIPGALQSWITMVESACAVRGAGILSGASALTYAMRPELPTLRCPTLLLWGDKDTFGPPAWGQDMARLMPDARCIVVPDAGHLPWLDQPDLCARAIDFFLA